MSIPDQPSPTPYRFGWIEIVLSTLAILALAVPLFLAVSAIGWFLVILAIGTVPIETMIDTMKDRTAVRTDANIQLVFQCVGLLLYGSIALALFIIARHPRRMPLFRRVAFLDWTMDRQYWLLLLATLVYAVVSGLWLGWVKPEARDWVTLPKTTVPLFLAFLAIVGIGPLVEELLFRGWIFTALRTRLAFVPALLITSGIFALMHFEASLLYALVVFPVGLMLGFVRERYGSIKASALFHSIYNLFALIVTYFDIA